MKRNFGVLVVNIWAKSIGAIIGSAVCFRQFTGYKGEPRDVAILAGYCALGYMAGNLVSAVLSIRQTAIADTEKSEK